MNMTITQRDLHCKRLFSTSVQTMVAEPESKPGRSAWRSTLDRNE